MTPACSSCGVNNLITIILLGQKHYPLLGENNVHFFFFVFRFSTSLQTYEPYQMGKAQMCWVIKPQGGDILKRRGPMTRHRE